jgi:hypothetical protein
MSESTSDTQNQDTAPDRSSSGDDPAADGRITDDMLPEDLQPTDDNPLAKPPSDEDDEDAGMSLGPDGPQA